MASIEKHALESQVVERLAQLLRRSCELEFSTTAALSHFTTLLAWAMHRVKKPDEAAGQALNKMWRATPASAPEWNIPPPLENLSVFDALDQLRNAAAHAGVRSADPLNEDGCLVGFSLGADAGSVQLREHELCRIGAQIAAEFVAAMRS